MKSPILGLRTIAYFVSDINKAKEWYKNAFQTEPYFDQPFYVGFNIGGYELGLQPDENPHKEKPKSVIAYWGVEDINQEYQRFLKAGATEHEKPLNVGGDLMVASVKDPWGNIIGIIYNPEFKLK
jgi:lactoylglutathione lyase